MKILIYGVNYAPELTGTGKYTAEMAAWLAARGHTVDVIVPPPYYPQWRIQAGYRAGAYTRETIDGVTVHRAPIWVPTQPGGVKRLIHLATFALSSLPTLARRALGRPDVVMIVAPALFCAPAAWLAARACGARAWLHIQDYEVDAAFELGLLKGRWLRRMVTACEGALLRRFDRVSTISSRMLALAAAKGVAGDRLFSLPNWIDLQAIQPTEGVNPYRAEWATEPGHSVAMYAGNMGGKQGLETLATVAYLLRREPIDFVFCGQGSGREELERRCAGLRNVRFLDLQPVERLGDLLNAADIHLLPQRRGAADLVMPSKLTGMLASGKPVVCGAAAGTELALVVNQCGIITPPENARAMARAVRSLAHDPQRRAALGRAARTYAVTTLDRDAVLTRLEQALLDSVAAKPGAPAQPAVRRG